MKIGESQPAPEHLISGTPYHAVEEPKDSLDGMDIKGLTNIFGMPTRPYTALARQGIKKIGELRSYSYKELSKAPAMGKVSLADLKEVLDRIGIVLPEQSLKEIYTRSDPSTLQLEEDNWEPGEDYDDEPLDDDDELLNEEDHDHWVEGDDELVD